MQLCIPDTQSSLSGCGDAAVRHNGCEAVVLTEELGGRCSCRGSTGGGTGSGGNGTARHQPNRLGVYILINIYS